MTDRKPIIPFSLRLRDEERAQLEKAAGGMPLGTYIKWRLIDPNAEPPKRRRAKEPIKDHRAFSQALGLLGSSRVAGNLNQVAKAVHSGLLTLPAPLEAELLEAIRHVAEIRRLLIEALDLSDHGS